MGFVASRISRIFILDGCPVFLERDCVVDARIVNAGPREFRACLCAPTIHNQRTWWLRVPPNGTASPDANCCKLSTMEFWRTTNYRTRGATQLNSPNTQSLVWQSP